MPTPRFLPALVPFQGKLWAIGGWRTGFGPHSTVEIFDPATNSWSAGPSLDVAREGPGAAVANGVIVAAGGHDGTGGVSTVEVFDPSDRMWTRGESMIHPRNGLALAAVGTRVYAVGGADQSPGCVPQC